MLCGLPASTSTVWQGICTILRCTSLGQLGRKPTVIYETEQAGNQQSETSNLEVEVEKPEDEVAVDGYDD